MFRNCYMSDTFSDPVNGNPADCHNVEIYEFKISERVCAQKKQAYMVTQPLFSR